MIIMTKQDELDHFMKVLGQLYVTFVILLPLTSVLMMAAQIDQLHPFQQDIQPLKVMWMYWAHILDLLFHLLLQPTYQQLSQRSCIVY